MKKPYNKEKVEAKQKDLAIKKKREEKRSKDDLIFLYW